MPATAYPVTRHTSDGHAVCSIDTSDTNLLEWIAAAKAERRAYRAWQRALPLAPINRGPDQYRQPWFGVVDRLHTEHVAARAALLAVTSALGFNA
ncbi:MULTISPECIES: hypothetical protein [Nocardia]|uniref:hypothetical protein n=1 Tax=Nocardia TaxID=1817 RepID=UPI00245515A1|nr:MULTISPECIES: hypothetical protein [Nocardia]